MSFVALGESVTHQHFPVCEDPPDYLVCYLQGESVGAASYEDDYTTVYVCVFLTFSNHTPFLSSPPLPVRVRIGATRTSRIR